jgi:NAD(P)H-flavin reductase/NAD-dependent dihydropyrimidine dehydrogenase PreA subunit
MDKIKAILTPNPVLPNHVIKIDPSKCIACYQCAKSCRCNVLMENTVKGQPPMLVYPDECWHCAVCTENCPTGAIEFEHPINQKITWKRKDTGELFRIGMKNPPEPYTKRAYGDRSIYLGEITDMKLEVSEIEKVSRYVMRVVLSKTNENIPAYKPGNFCNIRISEDECRAYSIASSHNGEFFELYIDIFQGGNGATFFKNLKKGEIVEAAMPFGKFVYEPKNTPLLLVGSVIGISPLKAILEQELTKDKTARPIKLLFQVWDEEDKFLTEFLNDYAEKNSNFSYEIIKANPELCAVTGGLSIQKYLQETDFITPEVDAYICGSKELIKSIERILFDKGAFWRNIFYESFM